MKLHHPLYGPVTVETLLPDGWAWILTVDDEAAKVRLDTLTMPLERVA